MGSIGEKVRTLRKDRGMTQSELCGDFMTRNMLSQIETDKACPSIPTILYIANKLSMPVGYFLSDRDGKGKYEKDDAISTIKRHYSDGMWQKCIDDCKKLSDFDDEICLIMAECYMHIGISHFRDGWLEGARKSLELSLLFADKTIYSTVEVREQVGIYLAMIESIAQKRSTSDITSGGGESFKMKYELALYNKLLQSTEGDKYEIAAQIYDATKLETPIYRMHISAKLSAKAGNYQRAAALLCDLLEKDDNGAVFKYRLLCDLEEVYKCMNDYKNAYACSEAKAKLYETFRLPGI